MIDSQYELLLWDVLNNGQKKADRTGTGTRSSFGRQLRYNLAEGFPLITTKQVHLRSVVGELIWFLSGSTNIQWLRDNGIRIWDEWADKWGDLGPVYGHQWRFWGGQYPDYETHDQIANLIAGLKSDPDSRRHLVSAWNVDDLPDMVLPPCHYSFQMYVADGRLSCLVNQRSADLFLGVPFNIASYALLTHIIAQQTGLEVGELIWSGGDCHIYDNHVNQVREQISREPYDFPQVVLAWRDRFDQYEIDDVGVVGYQHHPRIVAPVAV